MIENYRYGAAVRSATITNGIVTVFDRPATDTGLPGTVTAEQSTGWTENDWRNLANLRHRALRTRQRAAGMHCRMSPAYAAAVIADRQRASEAATRETWDRVSPTEVDRRIGGTLVETYYREQAPGLGRMWAAYPAGHAWPIGHCTAIPA